MRYKLLLLCLLLMIFPLSSNAQFIGIRIGIPMLSPQGNTTGKTTGGGGSGCSSVPNAMTFNGLYMTFNGACMTFSGTP